MKLACLIIIPFTFISSDNYIDIVCSCYLKIEFVTERPPLPDLPLKLNQDYLTHFKKNISKGEQVNNLYTTQ